MMRNIPLSRGAQLLPFIEFLDRIGAPTDRGLERSKLPLGLRGCRHTLVSTRSQASFVGYIGSRRTGDASRPVFQDPLRTHSL
jgi:hypothetical protein